MNSFLSASPINTSSNASTYALPPVLADAPHHAALRHAAPLLDKDDAGKDNSGKDDFVDLYNLLDLPLSSTQSELRKVISILYLEAQKNLDHRNAQKKFYYQQMYEVHLPRARFILLNDKRRPEYDEHVRTFCTDRAEQRAAQLSNANLLEDVAHTASDVLNGTGIIEDAAARVAQSVFEEEVTPEMLAARRESLWLQWQKSLEATQESSTPQPLVFTPQQAVREEVRNVYMRKTSVVVRQEERARREESLRRQQERWREQKQQQEKSAEEERQKIEAEQKQWEEQKQRQIALAKTARVRWSWGSGLSAFMLGTMLIFVLSGVSSTGTASLANEPMLGHQPYRGVTSAIPGKIEAEDYDQGMESTAYHKLTHTINGGGDYRSGSGVPIVPTNAGYAVTNTAPGEWLNYTVNVAQSGLYDLDANVASREGGGSFSLSFNGQDKTGALAVPATSSDNAYQTVEKKGIELSAGQQTMRLTFASASGDGSAGNFDFLQLRAETVAQGGSLSNLAASNLAAFARPLLLLILALCCCMLGNQMGKAAEQRVLTNRK